MWLKEELERKFSSLWWKTDFTKYVQNKTKQEQVPVLCCSDLISNPDSREHEDLSYTLINLSMLFNFFYHFQSIFQIWLPLIRNLFYNIFGVGERVAVFNVSHCLTWKKVTDYRCWYSNTHGLCDWNLLPTKYSFHWQKFKPQTLKDVQAVPKNMLLITLSTHPLN